MKLLATFATILLVIIALVAWVRYMEHPTRKNLCQALLDTVTL